MAAKGACCAADNYRKLRLHGLSEGSARLKHSLESSTFACVYIFFHIHGARTAALSITSCTRKRARWQSRSTDHAIRGGFDAYNALESIACKRFKVQFNRLLMNLYKEAITASQVDAILTVWTAVSVPAGASQSRWGWSITVLVSSAYGPVHGRRRHASSSKRLLEKRILVEI